MSSRVLGLPRRTTLLKMTSKRKVGAIIAIMLGATIDIFRKFRLRSTEFLQNVLPEEHPEFARAQELLARLAPASALVIGIPHLVDRGAASAHGPAAPLGAHQVRRARLGRIVRGRPAHLVLVTRACVRMRALQDHSGPLDIRPVGPVAVLWDGEGPSVALGVLRTAQGRWCTLGVHVASA